MASLRDEVAADNQLKRLPCSVEVFLQTQDNREEWEALFADRAIYGPAIWRAMKRRGYALGDQPVERHRRGDCRCGRAA